MIDVSVVIVNYNGYQLLEDCISTLQKYTTGVNYEVIVVDNGSSFEDVKSVISKFSGIKVIEQKENKGFSFANNVGIKAAVGKNFLLLNNDIVFIEDSISKVFEFSKSIGDTAIIGCKLLNKDLSHQISVVDFDTVSNLFGENFFLYLLFPKSKIFSKFHLNDYSADAPLEVDAVKGAFFLIPRKVYEKVGLLDERFFFYYEETEYCYRYKKLGGKVIYYPNSKIVHLGGSSTESNFWFKFKNQHTAKVQYFQKHFSGLKFITALIIHYLGLLLRVPLYFILGTAKMNRKLITKSWCYFKTLFLYPSNLFKESF